MGFYPQLLDRTLGELLARFHAAAPDGEDYAYPFYAEVASLIRKQGKAGVEALLRELDRANADRSRAAIFALTMRPRLKHPALWSRLLPYLEDPRPLIVAEIIDGLWSQRKKDCTYRVLELQQHPSPYVRGSVLRFVSHLTPKCAPLFLVAGLKDADYLVRENAVDELDRLGAVETLPHLRPLLDDEHPDVRQAVATAIENLQWLASDTASTNGHSRIG